MLAVLAAHDYALGVRRGSICACGFVPDVEPSSLRTQQDYHREHIAAVVESAVLARVAAALTEAADLMSGFLHDPECESCEDVRECIAVVRALIPPP